MASATPAALHPFRQHLIDYEFVRLKWKAMK